MRDMNMLRECTLKRCSDQGSREIYRDYLTGKALFQEPAPYAHNLRRSMIDRAIFEGYPIDFDEHELLVGRCCDEHELTAEQLQLAEDARKYLQASGKLAGTTNAFTGHRVIDYELLLNTGIRAGEAVALKYSDFDFAAHTVQIHTTAVNTKERNSDGSATGKRNRTFTRPKTANSDTLLHLSPYAVQIILDMKAQEPTGYDGFVVHSDYKPLAEKALWQRFDKLLRGAKVCPCGLHSLRHTYGTKLYEETQDLKFVCQQLRHSDPSFTAKTYVHQTDKRTREILSNFTI